MPAARHVIIFSGALRNGKRLGPTGELFDCRVGVRALVDELERTPDNGGGAEPRRRSWRRFGAWLCPDGTGTAHAAENRCVYAGDREISRTFRTRISAVGAAAVYSPGGRP